LISRDISFSGKGLVSRPANPRSIILDSSKAFSVNEEQTISNVSEGEVNMSENIEEKQLDTAPVVEEAVQVVAEEVKIENLPRAKEICRRIIQEKIPLLFIYGYLFCIYIRILLARRGHV
jgi:hypothetical protein